MSACIDGHRVRFGVELICRALGVSASAYYQRRTGQRSKRAVEDERLLARIREVHAANYFAYGSRRMWKALSLVGAGGVEGREVVDEHVEGAGAVALEAAGGQHEGLGAGGEAVAFVDWRGDDEVDGAVFVFVEYEDHAAGGGGAFEPGWVSRRPCLVVSSFQEIEISLPLSGA